MTILKLTQFDEDSVGVVLPAELVVRLNWKAGDFVFLTEAPGGISLSSPPPEFNQQMKVGREIMRKRSGVLRALADSDALDQN